MNFRIAGAAAAVLVAAGYASLAEIALRRRSKDLSGWNESFLIGAAGCAVLLYPLSVALPRRALDLLALSVVLAAAALPIRAGLALRRARSRGGRPARRMRRAGFVAAAGAAAAIAVFGVLDLRAAFAWDGFQIWATKAFLLFREGGLRPELWPGSVYEGRAGRAVHYPPLLPLFEAIVARVLGRFDFLDLKPIFVLFFGSLLVSAARAARALSASRVERYATVAMIAALPAYTSRPMVGGNADLPMAACVAGLAAAWLSPTPARGRWNSPVPWLLGAVLSAKSEGIVLCAIAVASAAAVSGALRVPARARGVAGALAVGALLLAARVASLRWSTIPDLLMAPVNRASLRRAIPRIPEVAALCARDLLVISRWGLLWPAFILASLYVLGRAPVRERALALASLLALLAYSAIFLMSNWRLRLHVAQAYDRLLAQIAPAAALTLLAGYCSARARPSGIAGAAGSEPGSFREAASPGERENAEREPSGRREE